MSDSDPPFVRIGPRRPASPIILSVPHSGRVYAESLLAASRLPLAALETLEDPLVDRLVWRATAAGATAFVARAPRAEIDLNRDEREIDPAMVAPPLPIAGLLASHRSRGGLGLIPSRLAGAGPIWRRPIGREELARRIEGIHRPYHAALAAALADARARFGAAVLLDCHSMPPRAAGDARVVFGDRHGASIDPALLEAAAAEAGRLGFACSRNAPYAGGHIVARHGAPERGIHALQLEIDRSLYLAADLRSPGPGFDKAALLVESLCRVLAEALDGGAALAAE